jgi:cathepsin X
MREIDCGSCWLHSSLSSVNDRIKVAKGGRGTDVILARQVILNCGHYRGKFGDGCHGGDPYDVFEYLHRYVIIVGTT